MTQAIQKLTKWLEESPAETTVNPLRMTFVIEEGDVCRKCGKDIKEDEIHFVGLDCATIKNVSHERWSLAHAHTDEDISHEQ